MPLFSHYIISQAIVSEHFTNEVIIVNMTRGHYYSLRDSAAIVWQGLESGLSIDALTDYLTSIYIVDTTDARQSLDTFLEQLLTESLIGEGNPETSTSLPPSLAADRQPFTAPVLEVYTDMSDLLALDPIHDVNPVEGWPIKK